MAITRPAEADQAGAEFAGVIAWLRRHQVVLAGLLLVAASVVWKAQFLYARYFYQDDFVDLDIARKSGFSWHYLSLVSDDHFFPGLRAITWVLARTSLYNWGLDSTVLLIFAAAASLAALRPGTHNAHLSVSGNVTHFQVVGLGQNHLCITGAEAGQLVAYGPPIP